MQLLLVVTTKDICSCLSVEKDEADRQKAGHSDKGLGKKALDPSTSWVVGLIVSPYLRKRKKLCLPRGQNMPLFGNRVMNM